MIIDEYLKSNLSLGKKVDELSQFLNKSSLDLDRLVHQLEFLFGLFSRSDPLIKITRDYSTNFKNDVKNLKNTLLHQEGIIKEAAQKLTYVSKILKTMNETFTDIQTNADFFIKSVASLIHLAKNTEIRAYQAKQEGRGLAIIAKETLHLAHLAQIPFRNFSALLINLKETAKPSIAELDRIIEASHRSSMLLSQIFDSIKSIDETTLYLQKIVTSVEENSAICNKLKVNISNELAILREQLLYSLNIIDEVPTRCSEINSLAQLLNTLHTILNSDSESSKKIYIDKQFKYLLTENIKVLDKLSVDRKPPLFSMQINDEINNITNEIMKLKISINDLVTYSNTLGIAINEFIELESQIENFFTDVKNNLAHLDALINDLNYEFDTILEHISETVKIFAKIKTLAIFARIEEGRSHRMRDVISPVVMEFARLESKTEQAFSTIEPMVTQLKKQLRNLQKEKLIDEIPKARTPDYSKMKIFIDDLYRVFGEKERCSRDVSQITNELTRGNLLFSQLWQGYENLVSQMSKTRANLVGLLEEEIKVPQILKRKDVACANLSTDPITLRPNLKTDTNSHRIINNFSVGLFQFGEGADIIPAVCDEYSISQNGTEYTFRIKEGIRYANGHRLKIEDLKDGLMKALLGPNFNFFEMIVGAKEFSKTKHRESLGIKILNDHTLQITLEYPFLPIMANLATNTADPYIDEEPPIGIGPFKVIAWEKGKRIILEANDHYFEGRPAIDEFQFLIINNDEEAYELFRDGTLSIYQPTSNMLKRIKQKFPDLLHTIPEFSTQFLCMNCQKPPFNNKLVRKAIAYAIDTKALVKELLEGTAVVANGIFPPSMRVFNQTLEGYRFNPQKAKDLLAEAGFKNGLPDIYPLNISDSQSAIRRAEFIKSSLGSIGIRINVNPMPWAKHLEMTYKGESILSFQGWVSDNGDPDNFVYPLFHSNSFGYPGNTFFFSKPEIDHDIENARKIRNMHQRINFYRKIEEKILDESPGVFLFHSLQHFAIKKDIMGLKPHPLGLIRARYVYHAEGTFRNLTKSPDVVKGVSDVIHPVRNISPNGVYTKS